MQASPWLWDLAVFQARVITRVARSTFHKLGSNLACCHWNPSTANELDNRYFRIDQDSIRICVASHSPAMYARRIIHAGKCMPLTVQNSIFVGHQLHDHLQINNWYCSIQGLADSHTNADYLHKADNVITLKQAWFTSALVWVHWVIFVKLNH